MKLKKLFLTAIVILGTGLVAQAQKITVDARQVCLEKILDDISSQTGFSFYYSQPPVDPSVIFSLNVKNEDLASALEKLFRESDIAYDIKGSKIYLTKERL